MKALIWIIIALVIIGGVAWMITSNNSSDSSDSSGNNDPLSESGRVIDTDTAVFDEIDDALSGLE